MENENTDIGEKSKKFKLAQEDKFTIEEFCSLKDLNKYYLDSLTMTFGNVEKKTVKEWTKVLVDGGLVKEKQIK